MHSKILSAGIFGIEAYPVEVQVDVSAGINKFEIVGLPESTVKEGRSRIDSAIKNSGYAARGINVRVNLSPATIRKEGSLYDLPIALGILSSRGFIRNAPDGKCLIAGELCLDGSIKPVTGAFLIASIVKELKIERLLIPNGNIHEVMGVEGITVYGVDHLCEAVDFLNGTGNLAGVVTKQEDLLDLEDSYDIDFKDVKGQEAVKRAVTVAVAGGHNMLMIGPPGSGKTMIAKRIPTILPDMTYEERIETTKLYSAVGMLKRGVGLMKKRPFRSPHHTISDAGMVGGNRIPRPGELSLANRGVLFLDEFSEFKKNVLEVMRQPLEDGYIVISRALGSVRFPSNVILVAAMNPCPCGNLGDKEKPCECSASALSKHFKKISNPLFDRIDIHVEVPRVHFKNLSSKGNGLSSEELKATVLKALKVQTERFKGSRVVFNARMTESMLEKYCPLGTEQSDLIEAAMKRFSLSARAYAKILKVARTIADLEGSDRIMMAHLAEAIHYRAFDRPMVY